MWNMTLSQITDAEYEQLRSFYLEHGERETCERTGMSRHQVQKLLARVPVTKGTVAVAHFGIANLLGLKKAS